MNIKLLPTPVLLIPVLLITHTFGAGTTLGFQDVAQSEEQRKAQRLLENNALLLLKQIITEMPGLKLSENRIKAQTIAADLLWTRDDQLARALFLEAANRLGEIISGIDSADPEYYNQINGPAQLRQEMLHFISQRDAKLARDFLNATRQPSPPQSDPSNRVPDPELQMEFLLASQIAASDPDQALKIALENLEKGFSFEVNSTLQNLLRQSPEVAFTLAQAMLRKLRSDNLAKNREATNVAVSLLQMLPRPPDHPEGEQVRETSRDPVSSVTEAIRRELLSLITAAALKITPGGSSPGSSEYDSAYQIFTALQTMAPDIEKIAPSHLPALRGKIKQFNNTLDPRSRFWNEHQTAIQSGTAEELLELAVKVPAEMRDEVYQQAAWKAAHSGEFERARQIANDHISNSYQRKSLLMDLERNSLSRLANEFKLDEVQQVLSRLRSDEERALALIEFANDQPEVHRQLVLQLLSQARNLISRRAENSSQFHVQIQLAQTYARWAPARSFEIMAVAIDQLNELLAAAAVTDGFDCSQQFKDGELNSYGGGSLVNLVEQFANTLAALAATDFDQARSVADRFQRNEVRIKTQLLIVQSVLAGQPSGRRFGFFRAGLQ